MDGLMLPAEILEGAPGSLTFYDEPAAMVQNQREAVADAAPQKGFIAKRRDEHGRLRKRFEGFTAICQPLWSRL